MNFKIIIIGSGIAAISAIKAIREVDASSVIHLIGQEKDYPYKRIRLSKDLFDSLEENKLLIEKKEWYEKNNIRLYLGTKAIKIDIDQHIVFMDNGKSIEFDKLLFASGARNNTPPIEGINKAGVYTLRTLEDAKEIKSKYESKNSIVQIGGGILGLELVWNLYKKGKKLVIAEIAPRLMPRQLDEKGSKVLLNIIESFGIKVLLNTGVTKITGKDSVEQIETSTGDRIYCDMVIYSAGTRCNTDIVKGSKIITDKGIIVNDKMETNIENVYAAGDVAEFDSMVVGLWNIAVNQGKTAGYNIVGNSNVYKNIIPLAAMNAFNISLFSMGLIDEQKCSNVLIDEDKQETNYIKVFINEKRVVGAILIGNTVNTLLLKSAIEKQIVLENMDFNNTSVKAIFEKLKSIK